MQNSSFSFLVKLTLFYWAPLPSISRETYAYLAL